MEKIAVLLPCYNEEVTIKKVIEDIKVKLPEATICLFDNNSTDNSLAIAKQIEGVLIYSVKRRGKGNVIKSMFASVDADIYVMVDSDDTYEIEDIDKLIQKIREGNDMVVGDRLSTSYQDENKRLFHNLGNSLVLHLVNYLFNAKYKDIMSGYRAFSRNFVSKISIQSDTFTTETEISIQAKLQGFKIDNVPIRYRDRPMGSFSKLNTYIDGARVLALILKKGLLYSPFKMLMALSFATLILSLVSMVLYFCRIDNSQNMLIFFLVSVACFFFVFGSACLLKWLGKRKKFSCIDKSIYEVKVL